MTHAWLLNSQVPLSHILDSVYIYIYKKDTKIILWWSDIIHDPTNRTKVTSLSYGIIIVKNLY